MNITLTYQQAMLADLAYAGLVPISEVDSQVTNQAAFTDRFEDPSAASAGNAFLQIW